MELNVVICRSVDFGCVAAFSAWVESCCNVAATACPLINECRLLGVIITMFWLRLISGHNSPVVCCPLTGHSGLKLQKRGASLF